MFSRLRAFKPFFWWIFSRNCKLNYYEYNVLSYAENETNVEIGIRDRSNLCRHGSYPSMVRVSLTSTDTTHTGNTYLLYAHISVYGCPRQILSKRSTNDDSPGKNMRLCQMKGGRIVFDNAKIEKNKGSRGNRGICIAFRLLLLRPTI